MQGWDSVEIRADVELGGTEQLFSLLVARDLQQSQGQEPQVAMTMPILVGTDGVRRMGKSLGNYIGVAESAENQFGKIMSIPDEPMRQYFTLLTELPLDEVDRLLAPGVNPRDAKEVLGKAIVAQYHGAEAAERAAAEFRRRAAGEDPDEIPDVALDRRQARRRGSHPGLRPAQGARPGVEHVERPPRDRAGGDDHRPGPRGDHRSQGPRSTSTDGLIVRVGKRKIVRVRQRGAECSQVELEQWPPERADASMAKHGFGIIGCGMIAEFHTRAINEIENARVVGGLEPQSGQRRQDRRAGQGGLSRSSTTWTRCWPSPGLDVVCICTPSGAHMEPAVQAARAGKHVVVEKPLEITLPRCDAIIAACDAAGVRLCTIFPSRFSPANLRLKEAIDARAGSAA